MKKLTILFILICGFAFGQNGRFTVSQADGLTPAVITDVPGATAPELYKKSLEWITKTYNQPDKVILGTVENEYIRYEGYEQNLFCFNALGMKNCNDVKYQIEINFKDGRYKFSVTSLADYLKPSQYTSGGWRQSQLSTFASNCYKKNGEVKPMCKDYVVDVPIYFSKLENSLNDYITLGDKKNDW